MPFVTLLSHLGLLQIHDFVSDFVAHDKLFQIATGEQLSTNCSAWRAEAKAMKAGNLPCEGCRWHYYSCAC